MEKQHNEAVDASRTRAEHNAVLANDLSQQLRDALERIEVGDK